MQIKTGEMSPTQSVLKPFITVAILTSSLELGHMQEFNRK